MTTAIVPSEHPKWDAFKANFLQSNYITDFWNWLLTLLSKSAELVLFGSILYSSYQLIPGVPSVPAGLDAFLFLVQQAALDIGGMGLLKLAKRAGLPRNSFPMQVGVTLVVLMILNVVLATVKHALPMVPGSVFVVAEALLLTIRAIMAVLFGHAIHALRDEYGDSMITVKEARELEARIDELSSELAQLAKLPHNLQQQFARELAQLAQDLYQGIDASSSGLAYRLQQLAENLASVQETVQQHHDELALLPTLQAHLQAWEQAYQEELQQLHTALDTHHKRDERPALHVVSPVSPKASETRPAPAHTFNARAFVFTHLQANPELKLAELEQLALEGGQELSQSSISRYRKQFFTRTASSLASNDASCESSTVQAFLASARYASERSGREERHVSGE